jgi:hypothetical protein
MSWLEVCICFRLRLRVEGGAKAEILQQVVSVFLSLSQEVIVLQNQDPFKIVKIV